MLRIFPPRPSPYQERGPTNEAEIISCRFATLLPNENLTSGVFTWAACQRSTALRRNRRGYHYPFDDSRRGELWRVELGQPGDGIRGAGWRRKGIPRPIVAKCLHRRGHRANS